MDKCLLKLYIAGRTSRSQTAVANLKRLCSEILTECDVEVIDVLERPHLAESEKIMATPTLVKALPEPIRRVIGDLSDASRVMLGLELLRPIPAEDGFPPAAAITRSAADHGGSPAERTSRSDPC